MQVGAGAVRPVLRDGPSRVEVENEVVEVLERRARDDVHAVFRVERVGHVQFVAGVNVRIEQRGGRVERVVSARGPVIEAGLVQRQPDRAGDRVPFLAQALFLGPVARLAEELVVDDRKLLDRVPKVFDVRLFRCDF